jgi:hypothetical protein
MEKELNIYNISCYQKDIGYAQNYLKELTIISDDKEKAIELAIEWQNKNNAHFIYPKDEWKITCKGKFLENSVVDYICGCGY